jgi:hypothetical protein
MSVYQESKNKTKRQLEKVMKAYNNVYIIALENHNEISRIKKTIWYKIGDFFGFM